LSGVGVLTASAVAPLWPTQQFRCGRQFAAWLGSRRDNTRPAATPARPHHAARRHLRARCWSGPLGTCRRPARWRRRDERDWRVDRHHLRAIGYHKTLVAIANKHASRCGCCSPVHDVELRRHELIAVSLPTTARRQAKTMVRPTLRAPG
jgi:hypothetical protein